MMKDQLLFETVLPAKLWTCFRRWSLLFYWIFCITCALGHYYFALVPLRNQILRGDNFMEISHTLSGLFLMCTNYIGVFAHLFTMTLHGESLRALQRGNSVAKTPVGTAAVAAILAVIGNIARHSARTRPALAVMYTFYTLQALAVLLIATQYAHMMSEHTRQLRKVTRYIKLSSLSRKTPQNWAYESCVTRKEETIPKMHRVHSFFSISISFIIFNIFTDSVFNAYYIIIYSALGSAGVVFGLAYAPVVALKFMTLYLICATSQNARNSADAFNYELYKIVKSDRELCRDKKLVMVVKTKRTVKFTAGGFIVLGNEFIVTMMAAVTTYIVTLVQCSQLKSLKQAHG